MLFLLCLPHRFYPWKEFAQHFSLGGNQLLVFPRWEQTWQTQGLLVAFSFWSPTIFSVTALQHQGCYHAITNIQDSGYFCFLLSKIVSSILHLIPSIGPSWRDSDITETDHWSLCQIMILVKYFANLWLQIVFDLYGRVPEKKKCFLSSIAKLPLSPPSAPSPNLGKVVHFFWDAKNTQPNAKSDFRKAIFLECQIHPLTIDTLVTGWNVLTALQVGLWEAVQVLFGPKIDPKIWFFMPHLYTHLFCLSRTRLREAVP